MINFGREICGSLAESGAAEWLVTNGIGGYASGTISGQLRRRYHGLLIAALKPPLERKLLLSKIDETVEYDQKCYPLYTNHWIGGVGEPYGFQNLEHFRLEGTTPVWTFAFADAILEKRLWLQAGQNTAYIRYDFLRGSLPLMFSSKLLINYRDHNNNTHADDWCMDIQAIDNGLKVKAFEDATPFYLLSDNAKLTTRHTWYRNFYLSLEGCRGFDAMDDHLYGGELEQILKPGQSLTMVATTESLLDLDLDGVSAYQKKQAYEEELLCRSQHITPSWMKQLILSADQFIVHDNPLVEKEAYSIITGYPWLGDRNQSSIMSLPGLTLATGRFEEAASILRAFGHSLNKGKQEQNISPISNHNHTPEAILYYIEALRAYLESTGNQTLIAELFSTAENIIQDYNYNSQNHVRLDPQDNLLYIEKTSEKKGLRIGKPVDLNALWFNAVLSIAHFASELGKPAVIYLELADKIQKSFRRFWQEDKGFCFDILDGPEGHDMRLRPYQLLAVSLNYSPLQKDQQKSIVDICAQKLLTSYGLRSLASDEFNYIGRYEGYQQKRAAAYHEGAVWSWLIGPFISAHYLVYKDAELARSFLAPFEDHLYNQGLGTIGEIFDGDAPFNPRGAIARASGVAEVLRAWQATNSMFLSVTKPPEKSLPYVELILDVPDDNVQFLNKGKYNHISQVAYQR